MSCTPERGFRCFAHIAYPVPTCRKGKNEQSHVETQVTSLYYYFGIIMLCRRSKYSGTAWTETQTGGIVTSCYEASQWNQKRPGLRPNWRYCGIIILCRI